MILTSNRPNKSAARNDLARKAKGETLVFIDSVWIGVAIGFLSWFIQHMLKRFWVFQKWAGS